MSTNDTTQDTPDILIPPEAERLLRHLAALLVEAVRRRQQPVVQSEDTEQAA